MYPSLVPGSLKPLCKISKHVDKGEVGNEELHLIQPLAVNVLPAQTVNTQ